MVVSAVLFGLFQCLALAIELMAVTNDAPDPFLSTPVNWLGILFGPVIYLLADNESNRRVTNLVVVALFVIAAVLGLTPGRFFLFPYYHQILLMGAMVSGVAIACYNFPRPAGSSKIKHRILIGILAWGPLVSATIWLTLLSGPIV